MRLGAVVGDVILTGENDDADVFGKVADFGGIAGKVGNVNDACRSRWAASGGGGGLRPQNYHF